MHDDQTLQEHFNTAILKEINKKSSQEAEWLGCNDLCVLRGWGGLSDKCLNHTPSLLFSTQAVQNSNCPFLPKHSFFIKGDSWLDLTIWIVTFVIIYGRILNSKYKIQR